MKENLYIRHGMRYRKIGRDEVIQAGAMHSYCGGELKPVINKDTIGDTPSSFSPERDFFNPINARSNFSVGDRIIVVSDSVDNYNYFSEGSGGIVVDYGDDDKDSILVHFDHGEYYAECNGEWYVACVDAKKVQK